MGVSYNAIIRQMKNELKNLDDSTSDQHVMAKMHVIKSLADVVINSYEEVGYETSDLENLEPKVVEPTQSTPSMSDAEARMMGFKPKQKNNSEHRLDEDDANGESIFDF
ncbi:hypothetical protein E3U55_11710 [Filobacillus milosensis]|uniref:YwdI family protein n=1 Tax=Filobacillus milosensis TaxID=94137 RepID=A0A4Y8IJ75_9BACI|nr:DUF5327 family protein [Filobacillus milosensis]TFB18930.1 hypothetical protein E3U55_11710 [Filobacillus milosensis]